MRKKSQQEKGKPSYDSLNPDYQKGFSQKHRPEVSSSEALNGEAFPTKVKASNEHAEIDAGKRINQKDSRNNCCQKFAFCQMVTCFMLAVALISCSLRGKVQGELALPAANILVSFYNQARLLYKDADKRRKDADKRRDE